MTSTTISSSSNPDKPHSQETVQAHLYKNNQLQNIKKHNKNQNGLRGAYLRIEKFPPNLVYELGNFQPIWYVIRFRRSLFEDEYAKKSLEFTPDAENNR